MAYEGNIVDLPLGTKGLVQLDNRAQHTPGELVIAKGLTVEDNSLRKEAGASLYDSGGITGAAGFTGTLASADFWAGVLLAWAGSGIATSGVAQSQGKAAGSTTQLGQVPTLAAGALHVVVIQTTLSGDPDVHPTSCTDTAGNVYTLATLNGQVPGATYINNQDGNVAVFYSLLTHALTNGVHTMSVTWSASTATAQWVNGGFTGITSGTPLSEMDNSGGSGTAVSVGPLANIGQVPILVVCGLGTLGVTDTPGSSFTEMKEQANGSCCASLNYRIDTTTPTIIAMHDWQSQAQTTPAGTVTTVAGSAVVVGVGTTFTNHAPGDKIIIAGEQHTILLVTDNTHLTTTEGWSNANAGVAYDRRVGGRLITATTSGNLFKDKPDSLTTTNLDATTLASGMSLVARPGKFVAAGKEAAALDRKLFYFNGVDRVKVLSGDGTSATNIATPPADWDTAANPLKQPLSGTTHTIGLSTRLCAWGNLNRPHTVYFSDPDDHEKFTGTSAFQMSFASHVGERVMCGVDYNGILVLWKYPKGIFYLDDTDVTTSNWSIRTKSEALGCANSPYAVLAMDDDVIFMDANGQFHMLSAVDTFGGIRASNLAYGLGFSNWLRSNLNLGRLDLVTSVWFPQKKVALFSVPSVGSTTPDLLLKFDFSGTNAGKPVIFTISERDAPDALGSRQESDTIVRPIFSEGGYVYLTEQTARTKAGAAYVAQFQTAHEDFSYLDRTLRYKRKIWDHLEMLFEPVGSGTLTVVVYVDGAARQSLTFDPTQRQQRKKLNVGDGHTLSVRVTSATGDMNIIWMGVYFKVGDEDQSR